ncbi:MAG: PqqD family protein [Candidatus Sumerlaeia bacterium]
MAIPHINEGVEVYTEAKTGYKIRKQIKPEPGISDFLARKLKFRKDIRVDLDQTGTFFWQQIDGKQSLGDIEKKMREKFDLSEQDAKRSVIIFTKGLMLRHLIALQMSEDERIEY